MRECNHLKPELQANLKDGVVEILVHILVTLMLLHHIRIYKFEK